MAEPLGLESGRAIVVPYDSRWPVLFEEMAGALRRVLDERILDIQHVGSTSVPGLAAKPVLDMLVGVPDLDSALQLVPDVESLGFEFRADEEIPDRHYFRKRRGRVRTHHLSLAEPTSSHYRSTVIFRDALRTDVKLARSYAALKLDLARRYPRDREAYLKGKTDFVRGVLRSRGFAIDA